MKRILLYCLLLLLTITGAAQPVITAANLLKAGDWYRTQNAKTLNAAVGDTGANRIWNYSGLVADTGEVAIDSFALIGNFPVSAVFGSPNLMTHSRNSSGIVTDTSYNFFIVTGDTLRNKGYYTPDNGSVSYFQKPIIVFPYFPYTYGYACADSSVGYYDIPSIPFFDTTFQKDTYKVTGYGTLTLPGNRTFNNVLQIVRKSTFVSNFGIIENDNVFYMTPGNPFPLLEVGGFNGAIESVRYMTSYFAAPAVGPTYTFTGNGNWNNPANWQGGAVPPANLPAGGRIFINPAAGGTCTLNVPYTVPSGCQFTVQTGAKLLLPGNLTIQ